jgi:hypothetical protein
MILSLAVATAPSLKLGKDEGPCGVSKENKRGTGVQGNDRCDFTLQSNNVPAGNFSREINQT